MENRERGIGWPLGLGSMYMRLRMVDTSQVDAADTTTRSSFCFHSSSFSSFSSSNLDTESSASFFQDNSKSLGRLIGVRPRNRRSELYATNSVTITSHTLPTTTSSKHSHELDMEMCDGICVPLCLVAKMSKNKDGSNSKR